MRNLLVILVVLASFSVFSRDKEDRDSFKIPGYPFYNQGRIWKKGVIPYEIPDSFTNKQRILDAIEHYHTKTRLRFVERTDQKDYIRFYRNTKNRRCYTFVGRRGGRQVVNLADRCHSGNVIHELGHVIGLFHEAQRQDRRKYIKIHWDNIKLIPGMNYWRKVFKKPIGEFDFNSIMMYSSYSKSKAKDPKKPVITRLNSSNKVIKSQRRGLSEGDIKKIEILYQDEL